ncbi:MAG: hypothetical protein DHS20C11_29690 [Lysobacteraceae bacterium]|nr:MAG: hypothetical protein DHS20C11_29690 [Xanthomonadaceae bacterium]
MTTLLETHVRFGPGRPIADNNACAKTLMVSSRARHKEVPAFATELEMKGFNDRAP